MPTQEERHAEPSLSEPLKALLVAYSEALALARELPFFVGRWFRPFLGLMLTNHIGRRVAALRRATLAHAAVAPDPAVWRADAERLDLFERSLPPYGTRRWILTLLTLSFVVAWVLAGTLFQAADSAGLIEKVTKATAAVKPEGVIDAIDPPVDEATGKPEARRPSADVLIGAAWIALYSTTVALLLPSSGYRLKQVIVTIGRRRREDVRKANLTDRPAEESITILEKRAFDAVDARRPRERSLDVVAQGLAVIPLVGFAGLAVADLFVSDGGDTAMAALLTLAFVSVVALSIGGLVLTWRGRARLDAAVPPGVWARPLSLAMAAGVWGTAILNGLIILALIEADVLP